MVWWLEGRVEILSVVSQMASRRTAYNVARVARWARSPIWIILNGTLRTYLKIDEPQVLICSR